MRPLRLMWRIGLILLALLLIVLTVAWFSRERIASDLIDDALSANGISATYDIVSIGPKRQVIANLVIGDPISPDLTIEQVSVDLAFGFSGAGIGAVELRRPRLYASYRGGKLDLGGLNSLLEGETSDDAGLPDFSLAILDGRARIDTDYGDVGIKIEGAGELDDGFNGTLGAIAPSVAFQGCSAERLSAYGNIVVEAGAPRFSGPVRFRSAQCTGAEISSADLNASLALDQELSTMDGQVGISMAALRYDDVRLSALVGEVEMSLGLVQSDSPDRGSVAIRHDLRGVNLSSNVVGAGEVVLDGAYRGQGDLTSGRWEVDFSGDETSIDRNMFAASGLNSGMLKDTLLGSLLGHIEKNLAAALQDGSFAGRLTLRNEPESMAIIVPEARVRSSAGDTILALSRVSWSNTDASEGRLSGNVLTGGTGLPQINGRMEQRANGDLALRVTMAEYRAADDRLAIPRLEVRQTSNGRVGFDGTILASGSLPGGDITDAEVPIEGVWSQSGGLTIARSCTTVKFGGLKYSELRLGREEITLCPPEGAAIMTYDDEFAFAASTEDLELEGKLGESGLALAIGNVDLRYPGSFQADSLRVMIGDDGNAVRVGAASLTGDISDTVAGSFSGGDAALDVVPLDLARIDGAWSYQDGVFSISNGQFVLSDRPDPDANYLPRFEPIDVRGARLSFDGAIDASAELISPRNRALIAQVTIEHDLETGTGRSDIAVPGIRFNERLQPEHLSYLAKGVIAFVDGTVTGEGAVSWTADTIESSGRFRSDDFDFAAAFGPVDNVRGEIEFTDLLNLTTAPRQVLEIGSINPGVEVLSGRVEYQMTNGQIIEVLDARWPFMGGQLILRPVTFDYGGGQGQSYVFEIIALDAGEFVAQMELNNLGASGTFDGTVPIYFDAQGNGSINGGLLISRQPGGNVSYIGELTYEDLGAVGNYAFQSLRSLDYSQMSIGLDGSLAGEIVTSFLFDGVRQGEGASRNFVTREIAKLPIRFNVNVRSETFYQLATLVRGIFDPTTFGNPIDQGLLSVEEGRLVPRIPPSEPDREAPLDDAVSALPEIRRDDEAPVQPSESEPMP